MSSAKRPLHRLQISVEKKGRKKQCVYPREDKILHPILIPDK